MRTLGVIGHVDAGKTTLVAALTQCAARLGGLSRAYEYEEVARADVAQHQRKGKVLTVNVAHIHLRTPKFHWDVIDCPGHRDYMKNMVVGTAQMDTAICVVDATKGVQPQTEEHVLLLSKVGVKNLILFISKMDTDEEGLADIVESEALDLLAHNGYTGVPVVRGSARAVLEDTDSTSTASHCAFAENISHILDSFPEPQHDTQKPLFLPVERGYQVMGQGTVITGPVIRGQAHPGDNVVYYSVRDAEYREVTIRSIERFHERRVQALAGDTVGLLLRGIDFDTVHRGDVVAAPNTLQPVERFKATVYWHTQAEGGRHTPIFPGYEPQLFFWTQDMSGTVGMDYDMAMPGDSLDMSFEIRWAWPVQVGQRFVIREGQSTVASGIVKSVG